MHESNGIPAGSSTRMGPGTKIEEPGETPSVPHSIIPAPAEESLPETLARQLEALASQRGMWAIIFAGGIGSRFWPLSSPARPKQLLTLVDEKPLIANTISRLSPLIPPERILILTVRDIASAIHAAIPEVPAQNMIAEPEPMGTAAALAWGVAEVRKRAGADALVCGMHADIAISFVELFHDALSVAGSAANRDDTIVLLGMSPTRADSAFGYVLPGEPYADSGNPGPVKQPDRLHAVKRFVEKPSSADATALMADGALWNTGMFVATARRLEQELLDKTPEVATAMRIASDTSIDDFAQMADSIPLERGLLERSQHLAVLRADFGWDDVGTWASLRRARELDDDGNGAIGLASLVDSSANVVHTEEGAAVLYGVNNLLVVRLNGITFVTTLEHARDLRPLLETLPTSLRRRQQD